MKIDTREVLCGEKIGMAAFVNKTTASRLYADERENCRRTKVDQEEIYAVEQRRRPQWKMGCIAVPCGGSKRTSKIAYVAGQGRETY
jgi:hypothetical protein